LQKYTEVTEIADDNIDSLNIKLQPFTTVIVGFHKPDGAWKNHDFMPNELARLDSISKYNRVVLDIFAKPYSLLPIIDYSGIDAIVMSYQNTDVSQILSAELIFGGFEAKGKLPVSVGPFNVGD